MNYEQLLALIGDNAEAKTFIESIQATSTANIDKINTLERQSGEFKGSLDKFKQGNTLVKSLLGLETINEDTLNEALGKLKGGKGDEASLAEIANLKDLLQKSTDSNTTLTTDYNGKLQTMALDNEIANSGFGTQVANEAMFGIVKGLVKQGATYEDGKIVYKNEDGSTAYGSNNQPMGIADKMNALKSDVNYAGLFKPDANGGSGSNPSGKGSGQGTTMKRSDFGQQTPQAQSKFMQDGGTITD